MEPLKNRKTMRLKYGNYDAFGTFFITICTKNRQCILSRVTEPTETTHAHVVLLPCGEIAEKHIREMGQFYPNVSVEKYVIMPNHIHFLLSVRPFSPPPSASIKTNTATVQNSTVSRFISTFKRFCNKEYGENIWQYRSYDHIIRNRDDHGEITRYIHENPTNWYYDKLYSEKRTECFT